MAVQRRNTRQRRLVLDAVRALHNGHPTADDVFVEVRRHDGRISRGTVYRNLSLLSDEGMIQQLKTPVEVVSTTAATTMPILSARRVVP